MAIKLGAVGALALLGTAPVAGANAASQSIRMRLSVPVVCKLAFEGAQGRQVHQSENNLGSLIQYCNSPTGSVVAVDYPAGTMRGTLLRVGTDQLLLDGSGHGEVTRNAGPTIRRAAVAIAAANGRPDATSLNFSISPL